MKRKGAVYILILYLVYIFSIFEEKAKYGWAICGRQGEKRLWLVREAV